MTYLSHITATIRIFKNNRNYFHSKERKNVYVKAEQTTHCHYIDSCILVNLCTHHWHNLCTRQCYEGETVQNYKMHDWLLARAWTSLATIATSDRGLTTSSTTLRNLFKTDVMDVWQCQLNNDTPLTARQASVGCTLQQAIPVLADKLSNQPAEAKILPGVCYIKCKSL